MDRRRFISATALSTLGLLLKDSPLRAQAARPKVYLFGMAVIQKLGLSFKPVAQLVSLDKHATFAVGDTNQLTALGWSSMPSKDFGLHQLHKDLPGKLASVACVTTENNQEIELNGKGATTLSDAAQACLPDIVKLAKVWNPGGHALSLPKGTVTVKMDGGLLRLPYVASRNAGTRGIRWRFATGEQGAADYKEIGDVYPLTDMLVFEANTDVLEVKAGNNKVTLNAGESMWLINMPTYVPQESDNTPSKIEHAHHVFGLVTNPDKIPNNVNVWSYNEFERDKVTGAKFTHPCGQGHSPALIQKVTRLSMSPDVKATAIPPDTDPCYMVGAF
jgi:hypothetical protein